MQINLVFVLFVCLHPPNCEFLADRNYPVLTLQCVRDTFVKSESDSKQVLGAKVTVILHLEHLLRQKLLVEMCAYPILICLPVTRSDCNLESG